MSAPLQPVQEEKKSAPSGKGKQPSQKKEAHGVAAAPAARPADYLAANYPPRSLGKYEPFWTKFRQYCKNEGTGPRTLTDCQNCLTMAGPTRVPPKTLSDQEKAAIKALVADKGLNLEIVFDSNAELKQTMQPVQPGSGGFYPPLACSRPDR